MVLGRLQRLAVFPRFAALPDPHPGEGVRGLERWHVEIPSGRVEGWYLPAPGASTDDPAPAVLFAHGNAELIDYWATILEAYRSMGISVLLPEYRGYGRSAGRPSERAIVEDFVRFHDQLAARPEVDASRLIFHGRSIGGGVVCGLARHRTPRALILMSTFTSVADVARRYLLPRALVSDPFDNAEVLAKLDVPVLLLHGRRDRIVPAAHGKTLASLCPRARLVLCDADHNDCPPDWPAFWEEVRGFLAQAGVLDARPAQLDSAL
ncbi:MAG: alpha/beta hydrolase [Myxococcota bacterium]